MRGGNRVGALVSNGEQTYRIPALAGTAHARYLMRRIAATPAGRAGRRRRLWRRCSSRCAGPQLRRGLVAVVSDFLDSGAVEPRRRRGSGRCGRCPAGTNCSASRCSTRANSNCPPPGWSTFADPETGRQLEVQTSDAGLRRDYAAAAQAQRAGIATALRHAGAAHLQLRTDRDWLTDVVKFVVARRRVRRSAPSGRRCADDASSPGVAVAAASPSPR